MAGRFCQECGTPNEAIATFCARCGAQLRAGIPPAAAPAPYAPAYAPAPAAPPAQYAPYAYPPGYVVPYPQAYGPPYPYSGPLPSHPTFGELERRKEVDRTKMGLLLLVIGLVLGWVPIAGLVGGFLAFVGAVLVIIGRKPFGERHATLVLVSVAVYVASFVLTVSFFAWFFVTGIQVGIQGDPRPLLPVFWTFIGGLVVSSIVGAVAQVLFVYDLEMPLGRYLLYGAFAAAVLAPLAAVLILRPALDAVLAGIANGTITNPGDPRIAALEGTAGALTLVSAVPSVLFAIAYFLVWQRIDRREIPPAPAPPGAPAMASPHGSVPASGPTMPPGPPPAGPAGGPPPASPPP